MMPFLLLVGELQKILRLEWLDLNLTGEIRIKVLSQRDGRERKLGTKGNKPFAINFDRNLKVRSRERDTG